MHIICLISASAHLWAITKPTARTSGKLPTAILTVVKTWSSLFDLGATYYLNKNMSTYVDYKINLLDENDFTKSAELIPTTWFAVGLVYQF
ncbi:Porin OmpC [Serratia fonticola]|uniref:Porin OmpC n=1 Tax=Serratia fonticola TaxID=47917 RepID=A0A4U9V7T8_SERFO|nr:Porin OmpC [Serratia fonticola]